MIAGGSKANEQQVEEESTGATVAIEERMDLLEAGVQDRQGLGDHRLLGLAQSLCVGEPVANQHRNLRPVGWSHPPGERLDVVLSKRPRALPGGGLWMRRDIPHRRHRKGVDLAHLCQGDQPAASPVSWLDSMPVDPVRCIGVPANLEIFAQLLVADRTTLGQ
jgi:hypothetical protein